MASGIDHIVIAVADPDAAADEMTEALGLAFAAGGRHPGAGTFNRISFLGDAYLELIGIEDFVLAGSNAIGAAAARVLGDGGGLATYALVDDDLDTTVRALRAAGSSISAVEPGSRRRPDGGEVRWWRAGPNELGPDRPPFLIRHDPTGAEWGPDERRLRATAVHPLGSPAVLLRLDIATADPPALAATYQRELGLEFWAVADLAVCTIGQQVIRLVPQREMAVAATVVIGADVEIPRSVDGLGMRFDMEPVAIGALAG